MSIFYGSGLFRVVVLGVQHSERHTPILSSYLFGEKRSAPRKGMLLPRTHEGILGCVADPISESTLRGTASIKINTSQIIPIRRKNSVTRYAGHETQKQTDQSLRIKHLAPWYFSPLVVPYNLDRLLSFFFFLRDLYVSIDGSTPS